MARTLQCRDAGFDCDAVVRGESEDEIIEQATEHARSVHHVEVDDSMRAQLRTLVRHDEGPAHPPGP